MRVVFFAARTMVEVVGRCFKDSEGVSYGNNGLQRRHSAKAVGLCGHGAVGTAETGQRSPPAAVKLGALFPIVRAEDAAELQIRGNSHSTTNVSSFHTQIQH